MLKLNGRILCAKQTSTRFQQCVAKFVDTAVVQVVPDVHCCGIREAMVDFDQTALLGPGLRPNRSELIDVGISGAGGTRLVCLHHALECRRSGNHTRFIRCAGHESDEGLRETLLQTLIVRKKERPVAADRTTYVSSELI